MSNGEPEKGQVGRRTDGREKGKGKVEGEEGGKRWREKRFSVKERSAEEPTRVCWYLRAFLCDASAAIDTLSLIQK